MNAGVMTVEPPDQPLGDWSVTAQLRPVEGADELEVVVVITRAPDQPPLYGTELDVVVEDAAGTPLPVVARDTGPLIEFGGGLGTSVNARFRFDLTDADPAALVVGAGGDRVRFRIVPSGEPS